MANLCIEGRNSLFSFNLLRVSPAKASVLLNISVSENWITGTRSVY